MRDRGGVVFLILFSISRVLLADSGEVRGRIVDPSGGALPGVTVLLTRPTGGAAIDTVSDGQGDYVVAAEPGRYHLHAELSGFTPVDRDVTVSAGSVVLDL